jgi:hypothetical protein
MSDWNELSPELKELCVDESPERRGKALETLGVRHAYRCDYGQRKTFLEQAVVSMTKAGLGVVVDESPIVGQGLV